MHDNTGDMPLPGKVHGEGKLEHLGLNDPEMFEGGRQGNGGGGSEPAAPGHLATPLGSYADGTHGQGQKANPVPASQEGR